MNNNAVWQAIINPNACNQKENNLWVQVKEALNATEISVEEHMAGSGMACEKIVMQLLSAGQKKIIIVGGDGTLNEVVNALLKSNYSLDEVLLALVPSGTGNDWARTHNIIPSSLSIVNLLKNGKVLQHDVGKVEIINGEKHNIRYFVNMAGFGFDAEVILRMNKSVTPLFAGRFTYLKNLFLTLVHHKSVNYSLKVDEQSFNGKIFSVVVGICKYNGGGMKQVPMANFNDNLFDVVLIEPMNIFEIISQLPKLYKGTHINYKKMHHFRGSRVIIEPKGKVYGEAEGEIIGNGLFEISPAREKIKFLVP